jgi:hypothetical protein
MKNLILAALLPLLCGLWACRKDDTPFQPTDYTVLPPATQTGANTFGCLVNGEVWVPRVPLFTIESAISALVGEKINRGGGGISMRLKEENRNEYLEISFTESLFQHRTYRTISDTSTFRFLPRLRINNFYYIHSWSDTTNYFEITKIDTLHNILSGQFNFRLTGQSNPSDVINITNGRFDLHYSEQ